MTERKMENNSRKKARKSLYYPALLDEAEKMDFELAVGVEGIDDEIALLRIKIMRILASDPENVQLIMQATNMLTRLVKARYSMTDKQQNRLKTAIGNIIKDIAVPLGISIIQKKVT